MHLIYFVNLVPARLPVLYFQSANVATSSCRSLFVLSVRTLPLSQRRSRSYFTEDWLAVVEIWTDDELVLTQTVRFYRSDRSINRLHLQHNRAVLSRDLNANVSRRCQLIFCSWYLRNISGREIISTLSYVTITIISELPLTSCDFRSTKYTKNTIKWNDWKNEICFRVSPIYEHKIEGIILKHKIKK